VKTIGIFLLLLIGIINTQAQVVDSTQNIRLDSILAAEAIQKREADSISLQMHLQADYSSPIIHTKDKTITYDIQQLVPKRNNTLLFILLVALLIVLVYIKLAYAKVLEDLFQSIWNQNMALQIFRTQSSDFTLSSFLLHINFIVAISLYAQFVFVKFFGLNTFDSTSSLLFLIFLFTFFYVSKQLVVKTIGVVFDANEIANEYVYNFFTICKTLGLSMIPMLFVFYTSSSTVFNIAVVITFIVLACFGLLYLWRGLSTGYKILYRSVYYFFIYVCVVEVSPIFLLIKLLTKTIA
jgi:hypothetical protein